MALFERVRTLNAAPPRSGEYVLYWAQMNRRVESNPALAFAAGLAGERGLPLLCYEGLTFAYPHASDRLHTFLLEGVKEMQGACEERGIGYCFYARRTPADPGDVLYRLAARAAAVVTDDCPTFVAARNNPRVAARLDVPFHVVDASCIVPMARFEKQEYAAYTIRPKLRRMLPGYLEAEPEIRVRRRFRGRPEFHTPVPSIPALVAACAIDHTLAPVAAFPGTRAAALRRLERFLDSGLNRYAAEAREPSAHATSRLSPYLHFGRLAALEVALAARRSPEFLEQLIVRRELAFNFARFSPSLDRLDAVPEWARRTLRQHARDRRDPLYPPEAFEAARTHDALWNATQKELLLRGVIHPYYRMYWGKKIIEWSASPDLALATMIRLHDRYALDGRDPNTYTNVLWCFGLHDRPWGERPIFGTVRYLSLDGMRRKTDVDAYIQEISTMELSGRDPVHLT